MDNNPKHIQSDCESSEVEFAASKAQGSKIATFGMVAYSGGEIHQFGEVFVVDLAGMNLPSKGVPIRQNHNADKGVGHTTSIRIENGTRLLVEGKISRDTDAARDVTGSAKNGFPWQASVGADIDASEFIREKVSVRVNGKEFVGPLTVLRKTRLQEVSFVDRGADGETSARVAASRAALSRGEEAMTNPELKTGGTDPIQDKNRVEEVLRLTAGHDKLQATAIAESWSPDKCELAVYRANARKAELEATRADRPRTNSVTSFSTNEQRPADVLCAVMLDLAGQGKVSAKHLSPEVIGQAKHLNCRTFLDALSAAQHLCGLDVPHSRNALIQAGISNIDMVSALGLSANLSALSAYTDAPQTYRSIVRIVSVGDLKDRTHIRLIANGNFELIGPGGEIKHGDLQEETSVVKAETRGKMFTVSRTDILNDSLGFLTDSSLMLGKMAARAVSDLVYKVLMANLNSQTPAVAYFSSGNGNLLSGGSSPLSFASLTTALINMRTRTDASGNAIDVAPKTLLLPPELEVLGRRLVTSETVERDGTSDDQPSGNPFFGTQLLIESRLSNSTFTGNSTTAWYQFARPEEGAIVLAFLDGQEAPTIEAVDAGPNILGVTLRAFHDVGCSLADSRLALKSDGA